MPLDPFFTSAGKDDYEERKKRSMAYAKAYQVRHFLRSDATYKHKTNVLKSIAGPHHGRGDRVLKMLCATAKNQGVLCVSSQQHHCLTGFRQPKKMWQHRNSNTPEGREII